MPKLPSYTMHNAVRAARIASVGAVSQNGGRLVPIALVLPDNSTLNITVVQEFIERYNPQPGGYMVETNGVFGYMPAEQFEASACAGDDILVLETRLQARAVEVVDLKLRVGQLEEALRLTGLIDKKFPPKAALRKYQMDLDDKARAEAAKTPQQEKKS